MSISPLIRTRIKQAALLIAVATLISQLFFTQMWLAAASAGKPFAWSEQLAWVMTSWYLWAFFFPLIYLSCRKFPVDHSRWKRNLPLQLFMALVVCVSHAMFQLHFNTMSGMKRTAGLLVAMVMWRLIIYSTLVSFIHALQYHRRSREAELQTTRIEARILRAQMETLKMQLNPDFLFETLRSIRELMHRSLGTADKMIARLGDFLRLTLDTSGTSRVPLRKEMEFVRCYLEVQKLHIQRTPRIQFDIDPDALDFAVPNLILYSLIEDAMDRRRSIGSYDAALQVRAHIANEDSLRIEVIDELISGANGSGQNLHERLQQVYGSGFRILSADSDGRRKTIAEIPALEQPLLERSASPVLTAEFAEPSEERASELEWALREEIVEEAAPPARRGFWATLLASAGAFTIVGYFFVLREVLTMWINGESYPLEDIFSGLRGWYVWAAFTPLVLYLGRKFPLQRNQFGRNILIHVVNSAVIVIVIEFITMSLWYFDTGGSTGYWKHMSRGISMAQYPFDLMVYWTIVAVGHAAHSYREYRLGEIRAQKLRAQLARAQLQALKMQLHPHFLFNTLNSISELMQEDLEIAEKMMNQLERFLLLTINNSEAQEVPFEVELDFLKCYLEIEHVRFQDRLSVHMDIQPQAMNVQVPNLLLQPIVENAIRHGIANRPTAGHIDIRATQTDGRLQVRVQDDGPGMPEQRPAGSRKGLGLSNTRERLQQIYGRQYRFEMENAPEGGLVVTLEIPAEKKA